MVVAGDSAKLPEMTRALDFVHRYVMQHFPTATIASDQSDAELRGYLARLVDAAEEAGIRRDELVAEKVEIQRTIAAALKVAGLGSPTDAGHEPMRAANYGFSLAGPAQRPSPHRPLSGSWLKSNWRALPAS
jgi:hypothetical protein